jgi:ubiquinone/menaquinone biosynthesis C-methylase UbiE
VFKGNRHDHLKFDVDEFHHIRWFPRHDIPFECTDPHLKRFLDKASKKLVTLNSYDTSVARYAENTGNLHPKEDAQKFIHSLPSQSKIIDIGCGPGRDAKMSSDHDFEIVGIDFSSKMIEAAKQSAPHGSFYVMDIETLVFPAETFEGAWTNCALLHVPKQNISFVLQKIYTILKPKGSFYLSVKQSHLDEVMEVDSRCEGREKYWSFYEPDELINLLLNAKFRIVDVSVANKSADYHTHPMIRVFAEKF